MLARLERTRRFILIVLFADLTAVAARISIPLPPVPLTMQTAVVLLSGALLGARDGAAAQVLYVLMGLVGLPVFAAGGGLAYVLSPTFGYLLGFVGGAWLVGYLVERHSPRSFRGLWAAMLAALAPMYVVGVIWLYLNLVVVQGKTVSPGTILKIGFLIPLPGDLLKAALAATVARSLRLLLKKGTRGRGAPPIEGLPAGIRLPNDSHVAVAHDDQRRYSMREREV